MNPFEAYLAELLQGHITIDEKPVQVVRQFSEAPSLPVITLDMSMGANTEFYFRKVGEPREKLYFKCNADININTWCNTEEEREEVNRQVLDCYYKSLNHHYRYCSNYQDGRCSTLRGKCAAIESTSGRGIKNQCPLPDEYKYQCLSDKHELCFGTIRIDPPFHLDEYDKHPPLLRSVFRAYSEYFELVSEMGNITRGYGFIEGADDDS